MSFPGSPACKESTCNAGDPSLIPESGRSPREGIGYHTSILGLSQWLSRLRIFLQCGRPGFNPWVETIPWRRKQLPIPVFWPSEFNGLYSPWGCKASDMTEQLSLSLSNVFHCRGGVSVNTYGLLWKPIACKPLCFGKKGNAWIPHESTILRVHITTLERMYW